MENPLSVADPHSKMPIFRQPIHPMLVPVPIACFVGVLLTDLTYWWSADMMWANFSAWLVTVGVIVGFVAAIFGLIDFLSNRLIRAQRPRGLMRSATSSCSFSQRSTCSFTHGMHGLRSCRGASRFPPQPC